MTNYLKGNTWSTVYTQVLGVGASASHGGLDASLDDVWTDDGSGSKTAAAFQLSTVAMLFSTTNKLHFHDTAIYIHASGDGVLNLVADGEIDLATAAIDINATSTCEIDNTNTTNGVKIGTNIASGRVYIGKSDGNATTVNSALNVTGALGLTSATTVASGVKVQWVDANEAISGDGTDLTLNSGADIDLTATADVNIPSGVGLTFGDDGEKIEGDGTNLALISSGEFNITAGGESEWKTTAGKIIIDAAAAALDLDGHSGVNIIGNAAEIDLTTSGAIDLNSAGFTLDGTTLSIDGTDDSNLTVTGSGKDLNIAVVGGSTQQLTLASAGTGANALTIDSSAGGMDILSTGGTSDIDIYNTGGSVNITATEDHTAALTLTTTQGGIDILATGAAADDIDIVAAGTSINITATEGHAESIYINSDGDTASGIKIHADTGNIDKSIYLLSDIGSVTIDSGNTSSDKGVLINTNVSGGKVYIGHTTSETTVKDNLTVTGDLSVGGSAAYGTLGISHATAAVFTLDNQEHSNSDGARDITFKFTGEKADGTSVDDMAQILVAHDGSSDDQAGYIDFKTNGGSEGTSPGSALKLSGDKTATFGGAIGAGTNAITCGQLNADNLRLDGNAITSTDTDGDITMTPNGTGNVKIIGCDMHLDSDSIVEQSTGGLGTSNTIFGKNAGDSIASGGNYNSFFGENAGTAITTADKSTAIGYDALTTCSTSSSNTAIGWEALKICTSGSNVAVGSGAMQSATSAASNVAVGECSLDDTNEGDYNVAIGANALSANTTGDYSVAVGYNALVASNKTADTDVRNVAVGYAAGEGVDTGDDNVFIGYESGANCTSGIENTCIGHATDIEDGSATNQIVIGNNVTGVADNAVHIGNNTRHIRCDFGSDQTWDAPSDIRQKTDIKDDILSLDFIKDIRPVTYVHKSPSEFPKEWTAYDPDDKEPMGGDKVIHGFIAQEVQSALNKAGVTTFQGWSEDPDGRQRVGHGAFVMPLINAVKELSAENDKLKQEMTEFHEMFKLQNEVFEDKIAAMNMTIAKINAGK